MKVQTEAAAGAGGEGKLVIRQVWAHNVESEFHAIRQAAERFPYVSMDTEFPGVIHCPSKHHASLTPSERYEALKANVDALHLIQVGLAFAASPDAPPSVAFEINLREFDPRVHRHNPRSVALLADHGLDFALQRRHGVDARVFSALLMSSGLVCSGAAAWVTFHSAYDFGYLVKLLMGRKLPRTLPEFIGLVRVFFGQQVYDARHVMDSCAGLYGGLDALAAQLGVERAAGMSHQAGSDAALTWDVFRRIREVYFANRQGLGAFAGVLYGLELDLALAPADNGGGKKCGAANANGNAVTANGTGTGTGKGRGGSNNNRRAVAAMR
ncbi:hypothetical protein D1007_35408 [Hordeum vulgare]|uniref:poly(A)-specific ribonuclease n=1 Tax=Hordeum vulgare subsp. vulgare TaxID=112509 RepID=F2DRK3_HORVV|nr:probable CCR4-associated factor 1 homolog 11 [Hordeum vulgare subsp. vulgare]KAE8790267.1 hypothetical protein D1007_35408 [Hordeum vulgare]KAI5009577.1 hypothetical protein ZWY2020_011714 [Hordeum vulgare]BAJ97724.1 predicted protein [Hordeum vulgare subsp. vulgare]